MTWSCPDCDGPLVSLSSIESRLCADCKTHWPWKLKPGQPPIVSNNRLTRKTRTDIVRPVNNSNESTEMSKKQKILDAATAAARASSYLNIHRTESAREAGVATTLVTYYFDDVAGLRDAVMRRAVESCDYVIIAQGLVHGDPIAINAPEAVKRSALSYAFNAAGV